MKGSKNKTVSFSRLSTFWQCQRKWHLRYNEHLLPKRDDFKFVEGRIFDEGLRVFYGEDDPKTRKTTMWKNFDEAKHHALQHVQRMISDAEKDGTLKESDTKKYQKVQNLLSAFEVYIDHVGKEDLQRYKVVYQQLPVRMDLQNGWVLEGFVDGIWKDVRSKTVYLVEHKYFAPGAEGLFDLDMQVSMYTLCLADQGFGLLPSLYNRISKPRFELKQGKESHQELRARAMKAISSAPVKYFSRDRYSRSRFQLEIVLEQINRTVKELDRPVSELPMYRNVGQHCRWGCSFTDICLRADPAILVAHFDTGVRCKKCNTRGRTPWGEREKWKCPTCEKSEEAGGKIII